MHSVFYDSKLLLEGSFGLYLPNLSASSGMFVAPGSMQMRLVQICVSYADNTVPPFLSFSAVGGLMSVLTSVPVVCGSRLFCSLIQ